MTTNAKKKKKEKKKYTGFKAKVKTRAQPLIFQNSMKNK